MERYLSHTSFSLISRDGGHLGSIGHWINPGDRQTHNYSCRGH